VVGPSGVYVSNNVNRGVTKATPGEVSREHVVPLIIKTSFKTPADWYIWIWMMFNCYSYGFLMTDLQIAYLIAQSHVVCSRNNMPSIEDLSTSPSSTMISINFCCIPVITIESQQFRLSASSTLHAAESQLLVLLVDPQPLPSPNYI
jgi:hypothetical protein